MRLSNLAASILMVASPALAGGPVVGTRPQTVDLKDKNGGLVKDGTAWSSASVKGAVYMIVYVDPDEKDLNEELTQSLKKENFDHEKFRSVAIINMKATWKPNAIISSMLESKQKEFPDTIYVKDYEGVLVKEWGLTDDNYDVVLFDQTGRVLYRKDGKLDGKEIASFISLIKEHLDGGPVTAGVPAIDATL